MLFAMSDDDRREAFRRRGVDYDSLPRYTVPLHDGTTFVVQLDIFGEPLSCEVIDGVAYSPSALYDAWDNITHRLYRPRKTEEYKKYMAAGIKALEDAYDGKVYY